MSSALQSFREWRHYELALGGAVLLLAALLPFFFDPIDSFIDDSIFVLCYVVMALGLNIVVGFAGLLDFGYVAFYALGAYTMGWLASDHFTGIGGEEGVHIGAGEFAQNLPGIHLNFLLIVLAAIIITAVFGALIGLPTLRLRGDYIAVVTLAFGEIIGRVALNGDTLTISGYKVTNGQQAISPVDQPNPLGSLVEFDSAFSLRPYYWTALVMVLVVLFVNFRLRDSRLGRAWIAIREDEVAAASMGVPLVKTKLLAYSAGAAFGGISGTLLGSYQNAVNSNQFQFAFSIFILAMIVLGGLGSIWGTVAGAVALAYIDRWLIPDVLDDAPSKLGLDFNLTQLSFGIFGFLLVLMMVLKPEGLFPERRRKLELTEGVGVTDEALFEARV
jgi:branched-chain amino acid transport system permease protein